MSRPEWAEIIRHLYQNNGQLLNNSDVSGIDKRMESRRKRYQGEEIRRKLIAETDIETGDADELQNILTHLSKMGLVERKNDPEYAYIRLTEKGFDVAHERELSERDNRINYAVVFLTFFLVLAQLIDVVPIKEIFKSFLVFAMLLAMLYVLFRTDILDR